VPGLSVRNVATPRNDDDDDDGGAYYGRGSSGRTSGGRCALADLREHGSRCTVVGKAVGIGRAKFWF
jgi:hypothetical protein